MYAKNISSVKIANELINIFMEESNLNALFEEPNAYIQRYDDCGYKPNHIKKVVFSEPYENFPSYYIKEDFKKPKCDFCDKPKPKPKPQPKFPFSFDFKSLMPLLSMLGGKNKSNIGDLISILGSQSGDSNASKITSLLQNKDLLSGALNLFKGGGLNLFKQKKENQKQAKTTDFQIKNYTRVE